MLLRDISERRAVCDRRSSSWHFPDALTRFCPTACVFIDRLQAEHGQPVERSQRYRALLFLDLDKSTLNIRAAISLLARLLRKPPTGWWRAVREGDNVARSVAMSLWVYSGAAEWNGWNGNGMEWIIKE